MGLFSGILQSINRRKVVNSLNKQYQLAYIRHDINRLLKFSAGRWGDERYLLIEIQNEDNLTYIEKEEIAKLFLFNPQLTRGLYILGFTGYGVMAKSEVTFMRYKFNI